jgi:hypothetical protein
MIIDACNRKTILFRRLVFDVLESVLIRRLIFDVLETVYIYEMTSMAVHSSIYNHFLRYHIIII